MQKNDKNDDEDETCAMSTGLEKEAPSGMEKMEVDTTKTDDNAQKSQQQEVRRSSAARREHDELTHMKK